MRNETSTSNSAFVALIAFAAAAAIVFGAQVSDAASLGPISEEKPPASCDVCELVSTVHCTGRYCDNLRIECRRVAGAATSRLRWMNYVSEEGGGLRRCPGNHYIAGLACKGRYCDNISLLCVEAPRLRPVSCRETPFVSEERGGTLSFFMGDAAGQQFVARAMRCKGRYCDNKSFEVCEVVPR